MDVNTRSENVLKDALESALSEIGENMKAPTVPEPDEHIDHIVQKCNAVFQSLQNRLIRPYSEEYIQRLNEAIKLDNTAEIPSHQFMIAPEELMLNFDKELYDEKKKRICYLFPLFEDRDPIAPISKALRLKNDRSKITSILPYLLTAYYLNLFGVQRIRADISKELSKKSGEKVDKFFTYSRDVCASVKMFSYDSFLPNFYESGRKTSGNKSEKVTNRSEFVRYLFTEREINPQICYVQTYKVFIYSVIAVACIEELSDTNFNVDYELAWALFDAHTCAIATVLSKYYKINEKELQGSLLDEPDTMQAILKSAFGDAANVLLESQTVVDIPSVVDILNILATSGSGEYKGNSVQACEISLPHQQKTKQLSRYEVFAYSLRLLCSPFLQYDCDYPNIEFNLLEKTRKKAEDKKEKYKSKIEIKDPPHMPFVVIHARAKKLVDETSESGEVVHEEYE